MKKCDTCKANKVCDHERFGFENCDNYIATDVVPRAELEFFKLIIQELNATIVEQEKDCETSKAEATKEAVKEVFAEIDKIIDEVYNRHIFGNNDLDDIEHEAIMNFSADISYRIDELKQKYSMEVRQ